MNDSELCLKPINDLLKERFYIPAYQRGYRWTPEQVKDLLEDIAAFHHDSADKVKEVFYCLQPVVVLKRDDGDWEVIDGQQRLTTIFLILKYLRDGMKLMRKSLYNLRYETRPDSEAFLTQLDAPLDLSRENDNIDYYHMCAAYTTIENWFKGKEDYELTLLQRIVSSNDIGKNVQVIWYELSERENPIDVFIRLNMGKIPLTNAELIRGLFLRSSQFSDTNAAKKLQIAHEWDGIERVLQSDDFWYFIYEGKKTFATRIEYIFKLIASEEPTSEFDQESSLYTFNAYQSLYSKADGDPLDKWLKVKQYFMICEEWYRDRTLYHLIGYLVADGVPILDLMRSSKGKTKHEFRQTLRAKIYYRLFDETNTEVATDELNETIREQVSDLDYERNAKKIRSTLLLFNIATLLQNKTSNVRFPFDSYKKYNWDIEHIRSVVSEKPNRDYLQKEWLKTVKDYWSDTEEQETLPDENAKLYELRTAVDLALEANPFSSDVFDDLYGRILSYYNEAENSETDNSLANLALLDESTNRSYKNAVFPIKRRRILGLDKEGTFVPLCTTNAFLKYYSRKIDNMMFWGDADREDYLTVIIATLAHFFSVKEGGVA